MARHPERHPHVTHQGLGIVDEVPVVGVALLQLEVNGVHSGRERGDDPFNIRFLLHQFLLRELTMSQNRLLDYLVFLSHWIGTGTIKHFPSLHLSPAISLPSSLNLLIHPCLRPFR